eukprot:3622372-Amphidinium_carterae.1
MAMCRRSHRISKVQEDRKNKEEKTVSCMSHVAGTMIVSETRCCKQFLKILLEAVMLLCIMVGILVGVVLDLGYGCFCASQWFAPHPCQNGFKMLRACDLQDMHDRVDDRTSTCLLGRLRILLRPLSRRGLPLERRACIVHLSVHCGFAVMQSVFDDKHLRQQ